MNELYWGKVSTLFGTCVILFSQKKIIRISFFEKGMNADNFEKNKKIIQNDQKAKELLTALLNNDSNVELELKGTDFQMKVWKALCEIPFGEIVSYTEIAEKIGKPKAVRAVANAIGANPIAYFIPCHRVIRSDGSMGGYRWGINIKERMQAREKTKNASSLKTDFIL